MIDYDLPCTVTVEGQAYPIRTDYRAALDIIAALNDPEMTDFDKAAVALGIFYADEVPRDIDSALKACFWFISGGDEREQKGTKKKLVDWEKDFRWIAAPISKTMGRDIRSMELHWWTFLAYYYEIGDCLFAQIVRIRDRLARGKKLDKADREWLRQNADLVAIETRYTSVEEQLLNEWTKGGS